MFKSVSAQPNFPQLEKKIFAYWQKEKIIEAYLQKNKNSTRKFSFLDGPITANNPMGVHHAWGRTYKDIWQRFYNMQGRKQRFQNGFDCQGLWVEVEVERELGLKSKKEIENLVPGDRKKSIAKFVELCKARVKRFSQIQTEQSLRLGYFMDWENSYFTMSEENNYMIWYFLKVCYQNGWIYKGRDSVPWCPRCETAISQHEILTEDYQEISHDSVILKFPLTRRKKEFLLVWTTTPWTIPANVAIAVDREIQYALVTEGENLFWLAKDLVGKIFSGRKIKILQIVKGEKLLGLKYSGAFDELPAVKEVAEKNSEKFHLVVATETKIMPISLDEGTGLVHLAVSAGTEDFALGKKYGLPMIPVINDSASYLPGFGEFSGKNAKEHPNFILDYLKKREKEKGDCLFAIFPYKHRYPVCWRCKTELVWKVTDEWYIAMDRPAKERQGNFSSQNDNLGKQAKVQTLREKMIAVAKKIRWIPDFGLERELDWLSNMQDWLISKKNRYWGLALPIYDCPNCGNFTVIGSKKELEERAVSGWKKFCGHSPHKPWIDEVKIRCPACQKVTCRIEDVGNPWLDAGIVSFSTFIDPKSGQVSYTSDKKYWREWFPADFITESFPGQFKNWFYSLIAMATVLENQPPFRTVLGFGTLLGEDGRPMHKSWGNAIEFNEGADKIGVDVMRWMYATQNPAENLLFGYKKADETRRRFHLLLWNIYNFFLTYAQVNNFQPPAKFLLSKNILDQWIILRLFQVMKIVTDSLEDYNAQKASLAIEEFVQDFSLWYIRRSRERVSLTNENQEDKERCLATLYEILVILVKILAPFVPFLSEEIFLNLTGKKSVHLEDWPSWQSFPFFSKISPSLTREMDLVRKLCEIGHSLRKEKKIKVRQPLPKIIFFNAELKEEKALKILVREELNIKEVILKKGKGEIRGELDTHLTPQLLAEGEAREWVRQIQMQRKKMGCSLTEKIKVILPSWPREFTEYIKKETLAQEILLGKEFQILRI